MQTIRDRSGKAWTFDLNVGSIRTIKARTGISIFAAFQNPEVLQKLRDPDVIFSMVEAICQPQPLDVSAFKLSETMEVVHAFGRELSDFSGGLPNLPAIPAAEVPNPRAMNQSSDTSGASPESSESTPAPINSEN
jgi:hypothetical protein